VPKASSPIQDIALDSTIARIMVAYPEPETIPAFLFFDEMYLQM
jgi:hypothetical protein